MLAHDQINRPAEVTRTGGQAAEGRTARHKQNGMGCGMSVGRGECGHSRGGLIASTVPWYVVWYFARAYFVLLGVCCWMQDAGAMVTGDG